ncbi:MAG: type II toxin-antitoxin system HicB family antitoxin [Elusimicrobia bacterium]|nr:type II toxin-antitoxin system HicB family antitoxin [Elusimicrobiota bacterium]
MTLHYSIVVVQEGKDCWAYAPSLAGVYGTGKTPGRAKKSLIEAIKLYIEDCRADGDPFPHSAAKIVQVDQVAIAV